jgi:hypothetical protein
MRSIDLMLDIVPIFPSSSVPQKFGCDSLAVAHSASIQAPACGGVLVGDHWWWFDSYGYTANQPGEASWDDADSTLVLERRSERGRTVMRLRIENGALRQEIFTANPADTALALMLSGGYDRAS